MTALRRFFSSPTLWFTLSAIALVLSLFGAFLGSGMHDTYGTDGTSPLGYILSFALPFAVPALIFALLGGWCVRRRRLRAGDSGSANVVLMAAVTAIAFVILALFVFGVRIIP